MKLLKVYFPGENLFKLQEASHRFFKCRHNCTLFYFFFQQEVIKCFVSPPYQWPKENRETPSPSASLMSMYFITDIISWENQMFIEWVTYSSFSWSSLHLNFHKTFLSKDSRFFAHCIQNLWVEICSSSLLIIPYF